MAAKIKLSDHQEALQNISESLRWFKELWLTTANSLIDVLTDISENDKDSQTKSFLHMLKKFINARQKVAQKYSDKLPAEYPSKVHELSELFSSVKNEIEVKSDESKKWKNRPSTKWGSKTSEKSVFTSRHRRKPINKQASRGIKR